jgi:DNA invertase Pin-like site-specific DNA recombinase
MVKKPKRAALYLRVSTDGQTPENQRRALKAVAAQRGWTVVATYDDNGISGAKGRDQRPGLDAMLTNATRGRFNVVMVWAMDRLGRSLADLIDTLRALEAANVDLTSTSRRSTPRRRPAACSSMSPGRSRNSKGI